MFQLNITTPALLFSAVSLILLAYTNRFLSYAQIVRNLHSEYIKNKNNVLLGQIRNLRKRLNLIRWMQILGVFSLFMSMAATLFIYFRSEWAGDISFVIALISMIISLGISIWEVQISVVALDLHLKGMEED